jgi:homoserine kinase
MKGRVVVEVPASVANLGPGFDCLGLALELRNRVELKPAPQVEEVHIHGEGEGELPTDASNLILRAAHHLFEHVGGRRRPMQVRAHNAIPTSSGLGSSAAAILAGVAGAAALLEIDLPDRVLLGLAMELEGHGDNLAAAWHGGLTVALPQADGLTALRISPPPWKVLIILPGLRRSTAAMRRALPAQVPLPDAAFNLARLAALVIAFQRGRMELLSQAMEDRLHQPYRLPLLPGAQEAMEAGRRAGALGVALAGAGPGLLAIAPHGHQAIERAMVQAFRHHDVPVRTLLLDLAAEGIRIQRIP